MSPMSKLNHELDEDGSVATIVKKKLQRPKKYKVLLHNDDYTTMEFVVFILESVFGKTYDEAEAIMLEIHQKGMGVCGIYTYEIAESKAKKVEYLAKENSFPLLCSVEAE